MNLKPTRAELNPLKRKESTQESFESSQPKKKEMQGLQDNIAEEQKTTEASLQRVERELPELQHRHIK